MLTNNFFANSFKFRVFVHKNEVIYYSVTVKHGTACKGTLVLLESRNHLCELPPHSKNNTAYNGTVCTDEQIGRPGGVQMITFTEKLTNLKYELLMAYLDRDIRILWYLSYI
jgi:hypothetical protein